MAAKNDFKPFATGAGANVMPQTDWETLPALLTGFQAGKASSSQVNKAIRQAAFIAAALAQYTANKSGQDVLDDGDVAGFITKMSTAFGKDYQALDVTLTALAGLATGANQLPYFTGVDTVAQTALTAFARTLLDDADAATARSTLGAQASDATLTALAALATGANKLPYFTGSDTAAQTDLTQVGRDIIGKTDIASVLTYLQLGEAAKQGVATNDDMQAGTAKNLLTSVANIISLFPEKSFSDNDFVRIPDRPGGVIIQWGKVAIPPTSSTDFTLRAAFPTAGLVVIPTALDSTTTTHYRVSAGSPPFPSLSKIKLTNTWNSNPVSTFYVAIGY